MRFLRAIPECVLLSDCVHFSNVFLLLFLLLCVLGRLSLGMEPFSRFGEYTSNKHNISVALDPHEMLK